MCARAEREACAGNLRNPPEAAKHGVAAGHHAAAEEVHHRGTDLRGSVDGVGVGERAKQGVAFGAIVSGNGATRGPGVEDRGSVTNGHKGVPKLLLSSCGLWALDDGFCGSAEERLDCRSTHFRGGIAGGAGFIGGLGDRGVRKRRLNGGEFGGFRLSIGDRGRIGGDQLWGSGRWGPQ